MSLLLSDQKLGSHSQPGSSSHKFSIKGRQTGAMHRGHSWIFRAETYETMLAWYDDIQNLTEKTGEERNAFVRKHARSFSAASRGGSDSGLEEDEADEVPYSASASFTKQAMKEPPQQRPQPGRFPSELSNNKLNGNLQPPLSPSSGSSLADQDLTNATGTLQGDGYMYGTARDAPQSFNHEDEKATPFHHQQQPQEAPQHLQQVPTSSQTITQPAGPQPNFIRHDSNYQSWMAPTAGGAAVGAGVLGAEEYWRSKRQAAEELHEAQLEQQPTDHTDFAAQPTTNTHSDSDARTLSEPTSTMTASTAPSTVQSDIPIVTALPISPPTTTKPSELDSTPIQEPLDTTATPIPTATASTEAPRVLTRNNTDFSISNLHIPGEYPKTVAS
jgi:hypothetical protein